MTEHETNSEIVHLLDQNAAAFNSKKDEFEAKYGFEHVCACDTDYTEGRVGEATFCFANLLGDALGACERLNQELKDTQKLLDEAMSILDAVKPLVKETIAKETEGDLSGGQEVGEDHPS